MKLYRHPGVRVTLACVWTALAAWVTTHGGSVAVVALLFVAMCTGWVTAGYSLALHGRGSNE